MEQFVTAVLLGILGLSLGSFGGAMMWRLRARQLVQDKKDKELVDNQEFKKLLPLTKETLSSDRSRCLHCGHELAWYDLLPLVSWVSTGGTCRYCHKKIGLFEPLIELGVAAFFVGSFLLWPDLHTPTEVIQLGLWLASGVILAVLFAYDLRWFLLPNVLVFPLIATGILYAGLRLASSADILGGLFNIGLAVIVLSGLYLLLWLVSKGKWIGFGDIKLGLGLALLLADWQLALLTLFLANLIGCIVVLPGLLSGKMTRTTHVPFGPLLIIGFVISALFGNVILQWYFEILL